MAPRFVSALALLVFAGFAQAKPPELPVSQDFECAAEMAVPFSPADLKRNKSKLAKVGILASQTAACAQQPECPIDMALMAAGREHSAYSCEDMCLDLLVPPMRLRHLCPANVKLTVREWQPRVRAAWGKCQNMVLACFTSSAGALGDEPGCSEEPPLVERKLLDQETEAVENAEIVIENRDKTTGEVVSKHTHSAVGAAKFRVRVSALEAKENGAEAVPVPPQEVEDIGFMPQEVSADSPASPEEAEPIDAPKEQPDEDDLPCKLQQSPRAEPETPAKPDCTCPYSNKQKPKGEVNKVDKLFENSVMDNIEKLIEARKAYRRGEHCRKVGDFERAAKYYEKAASLCPGSRFDSLAQERIEEMVIKMAEEAETRDAAEQESAEDSEDLSYLGKDAAVVRFLAKQIDKQGKAITSDWKSSLHTLARWTVPGFSEDPCQMFARAIAVMPPAAVPVTPGCHTEGAGDEDAIAPVADPSYQGPPCGGDILDEVNLLPPNLPPIDFKLVEALEKVLLETGDPSVPKLVIAVDPPALEEEAEEPMSQWPFAPKPEMASLYVDPPDDDLELQEEAPLPAAPNSETADLNERLRELLDALKNGLYVDANAEPDNSKVVIDLHLGTLTYRVLLDDAGHHYLIVGLSPLVTKDLKALHHMLNAKVTEWIESMNSGGNLGTQEDAEEDPNDDMDLLDLDFDPWQDA